MHATSFPPVARADARILILGSLPGMRSLHAQAYYAHDQNCFWRMLEALFAIPAQLPYAQRCQAVMAAGLAIWDVCQSAQRSGSLDSAIQANTVIANDIHHLLNYCPAIDLIAFNGQSAYQLFKRHVQLTKEIPILVLPSTSPANARMTFEQKLEKWRMIQHT